MTKRVEFKRSEPVEVSLDGLEVTVRPMSLASALATAALGTELQNFIDSGDYKSAAGVVSKLTAAVADNSSDPEAFKRYAAENGDAQYLSTLSSLVQLLTGGSEDEE